MPKRRFVLTVLFVIVALTTASADDAKFKVTSYIPQEFRDFQWIASGTTVLSGGSSRSESDYSSYQTTNSVERNGQYNLQTRGTSQAAYTLYTPDRFLNASISVPLTLGYSRQTSHDTDATPVSRTIRDTKVTSPSYSGSGSTGADLGLYVKSDFFVSVTVNSQLSYARTPDLKEDISEFSRDYDGGYYFEDRYCGNSKTASTTQRATLSLSVQPGYGRTYVGSYAATALYLIDEFRSKKLLEKEPSYDDFMALTEAIYQNRNKHAVDKRIRRIEGLTEILNTLTSRGIIADKAAAALTLDDVWDYFPRDMRYFGWRVRAGFGLSLDHQKSSRIESESQRSLYTRYHQDSLNIVDTTTDYRRQTNSNQRSRTTATTPYLIVAADWSKPINLKWQVDAGMSIIAYLKPKNTTAYSEWNSDYDPQDYYYSSTTKYSSQYQVSVSGALGYIMSSRSSFYLSAGAGYDRARRTVTSTTSSQPEPHVTGRTTDHSFDWSTSATLQYRLSIPTTVQVRANLSGYDGSLDQTMNPISNSSDVVSYTLSAGITHYLF